MQDECMGALRAKRLNRSRHRPTSSTGNRSTVALVRRGPSRSVKNTFSHPVASLPVEVPSSVDSDRGNEPIGAESKCKKIEAWLKLQVSGTLTRIGKDLQGIRKGDEDIEVTPIKVAYKGHAIQEAKDLTKLPMESS
ncbi:hypothetical protein CK203_011998 [Vitis vinifera]|uniref:Uncharacterized protein n=1 Tax=Vitis vinifera TaxID=29760 RepID=A0A438K0F8_VITVI|nr:hypothetical protein CK203_011998 [Vitis vinifera]